MAPCFSSGVAVDKTLLRVLTEADLATVTEAEDTIKALNLDDVSQRFLLAQLYRQYEMWASALEQLLPLTETHTSANLWLQLGSLYTNVSLYALAEESYKQAFALAEQVDNLPAQAE